MNCYHCTAETSNGLALCDLCQMKAAKALEFVPVYFRNLARWRPGRAGSRPVPGSRVLYDGETRTGDDRVSRALDEAGTAVATWAEAVHDDRGIELPTSDTEAQQVTALCRLLAEHLTSIATLEWCGEFVKELDQHEGRLSRLTEQVAPGWYAGGCRQVIADAPDGQLLCGSGVYVVPGLTWVTCKVCGVTTYARDHLEHVLDEARDWVARPMDMAKAIVALVDTEQSVTRLHKRISKWGERGQVRTLRRTEANDLGDMVEVGPKRYVLGEVLDRLIAEGQTRTNDVAAQAS